MRSLSFIPLKPNKHTLEISVFYLRDLIDTVYGVVYNHKNNIGRYCYDKMAEIIETTI